MKNTIRIGLSAETWQCIYTLLGGEIGRVQAMVAINGQAIAGNRYAETLRLARNAQDRIEDALKDEEEPAVKGEEQ